MQKCLHDQIDKNVQVYVDDVVIKTKESRTLIDDLRETFANLRRFWMKLNPAKCTFVVPVGKLLGFLVSSRGIEGNPGQIRAIERMKPPANLKEVQKFTRCLASLSCFISWLGEKALPLYQLMKKSDTFVWTTQADAAFNELKQMLSTVPVLASPMPKEPRLLYIAATNRVISAVVVVEREEGGKTVQRPVYYLSEVLSTSKQNYPHYQKMTYGVYMAAKKLKHYFQEHPIRVVAEAPISEIISNKDASGRIAKWAIELSPYTPQYDKRDTIKSQVLADFFIDWAEIQYEPPLPDANYWRMHFDGSKTIHGLGAGIVLTSPKNDQLRYVLQIHFAASNNVAEYEALVHGLKVSKDIGICRIMCFSDSDLVIQQCSGIWDVHDANMGSYRFLVQQMSGYFEGCEFRHVPQAQNEAADTLSKLGSSRESIPPDILLEHLRKPSIKPSSESSSIYVPPSPEEAVPMEIDVGASSDNPGTTLSVPGMGLTYAVTAVFQSRSKGKGKMYQEVVPVYLGTALAYPKTNLSVPGTSQPMEIDYVSVEVMEIDQPVFTARKVPSWAHPTVDFMVNGQVPADEAEAHALREGQKHIPSSTRRYTREVPRVYCRDVSNLLKAWRCSGKFIRGNVVTTLHPEL
jgi:ribonuclease HI